MNLRKLYYLLPPAARILARRIYFLPYDLWHKDEGNELSPPKGLIYTGGGDFIETGNRFLKYFQEYGGLTKHSRVLDIGSGIGRMAIPLTKFLDPSANYKGFDLVEQGVKWCEENISTRYPNFEFELIKLQNDLYRSDGALASNYVFPIESESQDFIFLISVFTHLIKEDMEQYIAEISRMLGQNKTCFASFFVLDSKRKELNINFAFPHREKEFALMDKNVKSANIAFDKEYLFDLIRENNMTIVNYLPGYWRNPKQTEGYLDFQDIVIFRKNQSN